MCADVYEKFVANVARLLKVFFCSDWVTCVRRRCGFIAGSYVSSPAAVHCDSFGNPSVKESHYHVS